MAGSEAAVRRALISAAQLRWALVMGLKEPPKIAMRFRARDRSSAASAMVFARDGWLTMRPFPLPLPLTIGGLSARAICES